MIVPTRYSYRLLPVLPVLGSCVFGFIYVAIDWKKHRYVNSPSAADLGADR